MPEKINPLKKFINSAIIAANTDLQTGEVRKPFTNKPVYGLSSASEKMGSQELGFGKELLENNKQRFFKRIMGIATENGTWTKENIRKAEAIKLVLYNLPIIHYTSESRLAGYGNESYLGLSNLNNQGLLNGEQVTLNGGLALNSYQEDIDIDRHKYVYACLGQLYFVGGNLGNDTCAIFLNKDLLKQPSCLVQDQKFQNQLGLGNSNLNHNSGRKDLYQDTNQSSLIATDYVNLMAIGMAT